MDIVVPLIFMFIGFISFLVAWYEEIYGPEGKGVDYMIVTFFVMSTIFFFFSAFAFHGVTIQEYSVLSDSYTYAHQGDYIYFGVGLFALGIISLILVGSKSMDVLGKNWSNET